MERFMACLVLLITGLTERLLNGMDLRWGCPLRTSMGTPQSGKSLRLVGKRFIANKSAESSCKLRMDGPETKGKVLLREKVTVRDPQDEEAEAQNAPLIELC
jgi:hypothetical protein